MKTAWLARPTSRRDFLKLSLVGALAAWLPPLRWAHAAAPDQLARVLDDSLAVYAEPTREAKLVRFLWRDLVTPIQEATLGVDPTAYNRVWYRLAEGGYVYSGSMQPVSVQTNNPDGNIPESGRLAEVSVPFTDAYWKPDLKASKAYRLYYGTTHWVTGLVNDEQGAPWYRVYDDKWKLHFYANPAHLRLFADEELSPISPEIPPEEKRLEVRLNDQMVIAYEGTRAVYAARAATGGIFKTGSYPTPTGRFITLHKRPTRHMAAGDRAAPDSYDLPGVPWVSYFTPSGVSFHGTFWHNDFGRPRSHGCVNLPTAAAQWIYRWTLPAVPAGEVDVYEGFGTTVDII